MNIENSYKVGDKTFTNLKDAQKYIIEIMYSNGLDWILENPTDFSEALFQYKEVKPVRKSSPVQKSVINPGAKGDLAGIVELLKAKYSVKRDANHWPVYHFDGIGENGSFSIRFIGKVWELYNLVVENLENIEVALDKYKVNR
jgi:hypothetical protein